MGMRRGLVVLRCLLLRGLLRRFAYRCFDAGASRLGKTDGDRLLRGLRPVLSFPHMLDFLTHVFTRLRAFRFPLAFVACCGLLRLGFWHGSYFQVTLVIQ